MTATTATVNIGPQQGPQRAFLESKADVVIFGGAAGGGKSFGLLLEPLRHARNPKFGAVIFRRNSTQVRNQGGLWHESMGLYAPLGAFPREAFLEWQFPAGCRIKFAHLEHERSVYDWQGSQIPFIGFDELTHFTESQFFYLFSRNRSVSGVPGYIRCTTNPDADSWVRKFIDWWIGDDGYPIVERSGQLRWFIRQDDSILWADTRDELIHSYGSEQLPKSVTFIPSKVTDNAILMKKDPGYLSNLKALSRVERLRLLGGNWDVRPTAGMFFQREWFPLIDALPANWILAVRFWDRAATEPNESNKDPDWTRGLLVYKYPNGVYVVGDLKSLRASPGKVETFIKNVATHDGMRTRVLSQQDPGSAGVLEAENFKRMLAGFDVRTVIISKDKITRAKPVSAQVEAGNISVLRGSWNEDFFTELENFPSPSSHDDIVDTLSGAFNDLATGLSTFDVYPNLPY